MKKVSLLLTVILSVGMLFGSQAKAQGRIDLNGAKSAQQCVDNNANGFTATFSFSSIESQKVNTEKGMFSSITMDNTYPFGMVGEPTVPAVNKLIAVPFGASSVSVEVKSFSTTVYSLAEYGIATLYPQQPMLRKDQKPGDIPFAYNAEAYAKRGFNEMPVAQFEIQGTMRGIQVGVLTVNPVQYDAANNSIRVFNDIVVEVSYGQYDETAAYNEFARTFSPYYVSMYRQMFNWRDDIYDQHPDLWQSPVKMLVITDRMFEKTIEDWAAWKNLKGFYMDINYTDEIGTSASAIKSFIQQKYAETAPTFLMIMGDKNQVAASATGSETHCVTDLYYMSTDGDEFPEMFHSRFPAENVAQMEAMLNKALEYEQYTMPDPSYLNNVLLIAGDDNGWGVTVGRPAIWYASNYYYNEGHGFENVYEYSHGQWSGCYTHLNTGVGFVNYTAHGSNTSWAGPQFTVSDVNNLTNEHKYFLAMGNCCEAADWGISGTCFGEAMVRAENKAAYAYIGSCPSTYWLNDYYFAVGATGRADGTMPSYEETTMGCYDAIWDDNAYNTVCAIPYIGNLASNAAQALGYTLHCNTLYCWQAYHALGDGSIMPFRVQPTENNVSHLPTVPIGVTTYDVTANPGSYVAISKDGVLYGVGLVGDEGMVTVNMDEPITSGGDVTICVTHPQHIPYIANVPAASLDGPYITYDNYATDRTVEAGAWIPMNVTIKNVGSDPASNLTVTLSTDSEYVDIIHSETNVASLAVDASYTIENVFDFDVAVNAPDKTKVVFFLTCTDGNDTWESKFNVTIAAPNLAVSNITNTGLTPGGNGTISFDITNNGTGDTRNATFEVVSSSNELTLTNNVVTIETIPAGETVTVNVNAAAAAGVEIGTTYELGYVVNAGHYTFSGDYILTVGNIVEDFETGDFSAYDWQFGGNANWTIVSSNPNTGTYCAKSGSISSSQNTDLILQVNVVLDGTLSFFKKVSSETNYDKLYFYIDNVEKGNWSGEVAWGQESYPITAGNHTLKWSYKKDYSMDNGSDCAWVDDIQFPPTNVITALDAVTDLEATVDGNNVTLNWTAVAGANAYIIRRNGEEAGNATSNTFSENLADGIYTYTVVATDSNGRFSTPAYVTANVGTVSVEENEADFCIYPNPVNNMLYINGGNAEYSYVMYNGMGQQVANGTAQGAQTINVNGMAKGIYFIRLTAGSRTSVEKVVVE